MPDTCSVDVRHLVRHPPQTCGRWPVLKELSKVEQRYDAVVAVIRDGMRVSEVAEKFERLGVKQPLLQAPSAGCALARAYHGKRSSPSRTLVRCGRDRRSRRGASA